VEGLPINKPSRLKPAGEKGRFLGRMIFFYAERALFRVGYSIWLMLEIDQANHGNGN